MASPEAPSKRISSAVPTRATAAVAVRVEMRESRKDLTPYPPLPSPTQTPAGRGGTLSRSRRQDQGTKARIRSPSPGDWVVGRWERGIGGEVSNVVPRVPRLEHHHPLPFPEFQILHCRQGRGPFRADPDAL